MNSAAVSVGRVAIKGKGRRDVRPLSESKTYNNVQKGFAHTLRLHVLASGSRGNAAIIEESSTGAGVMVDCGICKRDFFDRCQQVGFDPANLLAILITHEHTDHTKGLGVVLRGLAKLGIHPSVYADEVLRSSSEQVHALLGAHDVRRMFIGQTLLLAGMSIYTLPTSHDASSSCGFRFEGATGDVIGFVTDTGVVTAQTHEGLCGARILALESNHDLLMLKEGPYPFYVKSRVNSERGHLSNVQAAEELKLLISAQLEQVVALHISQTNNTYTLPVQAFSKVLNHAGHPAQVQAAYQAKPLSIH